MTFWLKEPAFDEVCIICSCFSRNTFHGIEIYFVKPEPGIEPLKPLIIINERPIKKALYINAVFYTPLKHIDMPLHKFYLCAVIAGGNAVLGNNNRNLKL